MESSVLLAIVIGAFLVVNLLVGLWAGRGVATVEEYAVGKNKWSTPALVMSLVATGLTGAMLMRGTNNRIIMGIAGISGPLFGLLSMPFRYYFFSRNTELFEKCNTTGDIIGALYGRRAKIASGLMSFVFAVMYVGMEVQVLALVFEGFFGVNATYATLISAFMVASYTAFGGIRSVVKTDILQFVFLIISVFLLASICVAKAGGTINIFQNLPSRLLDISSPSSWPRLTNGFVTDFILSGFILGYPNFQRILMAKNTNQRKQIFFYGYICWFLFAFALTMIAFAHYTLFPDFKGIIIIDAVQNLVPENLKYIVVLGIISILFSSGDSYLHGAGLAFYKDFYCTIKNKSPESLSAIKLITFALGIISVGFAYYGLAFCDISYINFVVVGSIFFPITVGLLGLKTSANEFWSSFFVGFGVFLILQTKLVFADYLAYSPAIAEICAVLTFIFVHLYNNSGVAWQKQSADKNVVEKKSVNSKSSIFFFSLNKVDESAPYTLFGIFFSIVILSSYFFGGAHDMEIEGPLLMIKFFSLVLCSIMATHKLWISNFRKNYLGKIWHLTLTVCLPFLSTIMFIISLGSLSYNINIAICILLLFFLVEWKSAILIWLLGSATAIFVYKFILNWGIYIESESLYYLFYQIVLSFAVGIVFSRKRSLRNSTFKSKNDFLEFIQINSLSSAHKSMSLQVREESQFNHFISLPSAKEKISEMIKNYKGLINESDLKQDLLQLGEAVEAEDRTQIYQVLNANKHSLLELSHKCKEALRFAGCEDLLVNIFTKKEKIRCDETTILKTVYKIASDHCKKIFSQNSGDDTDLVLSFFDTKILYESDEENNVKKLFRRTIDGIAIVLSEKDMNNNVKIIKEVYTKKLTDLEAILASNDEDINLTDIEKGIDAHYGVLENHSDSDYLKWVCVIPSDVYEIRPETLDMTEPINVKYNWPAAVELERKFVNELQSFENLNMSKLEYAVSVIKKYHFHQTRKSGEPYYMHPINVALIVLDIIRDTNVEIFNELSKNKEDLIIAALLHDILEDTAYSKRALIRNFGPKVRDLVLEVTKIDHSNRAAMLSNKQAFNDLIDKDPLSLCIKLADRLHNILTIDGHPRVDKRKAVAQETLDFFVPAAERYGLKKLTSELRGMSEYILNNGKLEGYIV